jgi:hypothetical protein
MLDALLLALALQNPPDLKKVAAAGRASAKRMADRQAVWTATHTLENGASIDVHVIRQGERQSVVLRVGQQDFGRLIIRDGIWYVSDSLGPRKHRPYEAAFFLPTWYLFWLRSEPRFVTDADQLAGLTFEGVEGEVGVWREPVPKWFLRQMQTTIDQLRAAKLDRPELFRKAQEFIDKGFAHRVHLPSGLFQETQNSRMSTRISDFMTPERPDTTIFDIPARDWQDFTDDPLLGKRENLMMLGHSAVWQPGQKAGDMNLCLVESGTGRFRRIPFEGSVALPGCFSIDRRKVYIAGIAPDGVIWPYEVDLGTGANRRLATNLILEGTAGFPALAPDGRTLAVLHLGGERRVLESDVALIDIETGKARYIGSPADRAFLSWLPAGQGLILLERTRTLAGEPEGSWISRMDLDGKVTRIREGNFPVLLQDGKTILFMRREQGTWATCDLKGESEKDLGNVGPSYGFPSPAPDGKRLLMMRVVKGVGMDPIIIDLTTAQERMIPHPAGLWSQPAWR